MNKQKFIEKLSTCAGLDEQKAIFVNDILENNFFISKKNKDKIISEIVIQLDVTLKKATDIYNIAKNIIREEIKNALRHPLKNKD